MEKISLEELFLTVCKRSAIVCKRSRTGYGNKSLLGLHMNQDEEKEFDSNKRNLQSLATNSSASSSSIDN